jgi:hypothetical protein
MIFTKSLAMISEILTHNVAAAESDTADSVRDARFGHELDAAPVASAWSGFRGVLWEAEGLSVAEVPDDLAVAAA